MKKFIIPTILILFFSYLNLNAVIINIPDDYGDIQTGIDFASHGDTVLVQPGIYEEHLNFDGTNLTLASPYLTTGDTSFISSTILDGSSNGRIIAFENGEDSTAMVIGFTLRNGSAENGGAIGCQYESTPVIKNNLFKSNIAYNGGALATECALTLINNTFKNNIASQSGGAVYLYNSQSYLAGNQFDSNLAQTGGAISCVEAEAIIENNNMEYNSSFNNGGAMYVFNASPVITANYIRGNNASTNGGGIACVNYSRPDIIDNRVTGNTAELFAGGIYCYDHSSAYVYDNTIDSNRTLQADGGGIWCGLYSEMRIIENHIHNNSGHLYGGGIATTCSPTIRDNLIENNENITYGGAGMYCGHVIGWPVIEGNTFRGNICRGSGSGGGIFCKSNSNAFIYNNEIYNNTTYTFGGGIYITENSLPTIVFNSIYENYARDGGGVYDNSTSCRLYNNLIYNNSASRDGGGIRLFASDGIIINNVIYGNSSTDRGGGIYSRSSDSKIKNSIIYNNSSADGLQLVLHESDDSVLYCNIQGGYAGTGNIDIDPLFRDPQNSDFHLMAVECGDPEDSPCIDLGDPLMRDTLFDCSMGLGGERSDMGAYGGGDSIQTGIPDYEPPPVGDFPAIQNYPNPFNSSTSIQYSIPGKSNVRIDIYNLLGQHVENLYNGYQNRGAYSIQWDASGLPSGIYYYRIFADQNTKSSAMLLLK